MPVHRPALLLLALCVLCTQCVRAQQPDPWVGQKDLQESNDNAFEYPEVVVQAEGELTARNRALALAPDAERAVPARPCTQLPA